MKCPTIKIDVRDSNGVKPPYPWYADPFYRFWDDRQMPCREGSLKPDGHLTERR